MSGNHLNLIPGLASCSLLRVVRAVKVIDLEDNAKITLEPDTRVSLLERSGRGSSEGFTNTHRRVKIAASQYDKFVFVP